MVVCWPVYPIAGFTAISSFRILRKQLDLRWALASGPTFREGVNVLFPRTQEIQKIHSHVFAGLANAEENQIFFQAFIGGGSTDNITKACKCFYGVFSVVVVPRNPIVTEECKKFIAISAKPLLALCSCFAPVVCVVNFSVKPFDTRQMLFQIIFL